MRPTMPMINGMVLETKNKISQMTHNRSIIVDTHAFGSFRKDLIYNIGIERTKGFLFRYGWNLGRQDAKDCKEKGQYESIEELIEYGPMLHSMKGYVKSITTKLEVHDENGVETLHMESIWENSFEADEHLDKIGKSSFPACYTLAGYASGYVSEVVGQRVIFKEVYCRAFGDNECYSIGKSENLWGNEIEEELYFLHEMPIVEELELTYEKLLRERDQLILANKINKILTNEVVDGADLKQIIHEVFRLTAIPTAVHTVNGYHTIAAAGFSTDSEELTPHAISQYLNEEQNNRLPGQSLLTIEYNQNSYMLLISPITLQKKLNGYCSFVFKNEEEYKVNCSQMIVDKISSICALSLFYEKTKLDSFEQMKSLFFRGVLKGEISSNEEIIAKANLFQLDLSKPYYICAIEYNNEFKEYHHEIEFRKEMFALVTEYSTKQKQNYLIHQEEKRIYFLITMEKEESSLSFIEDLYNEIRVKLQMCNLYIGVSKRTLSINKANHACKNAIAALRMAFKGKKIVFFESLGVVGALINDKNEEVVREMAYSLLGDIEVQCQKDIDLIQTLYSFLLNGGNLEKTADDLTLSISGLRYRIHKIEERLHKDLRSPIVSYQLLMSIQALIMLGDLDIKANVV